MEFQEIKQQMAEITSEKNKQSVIHPTSRNNETFLNTKLSRKPSYTKDKERKKETKRATISSNKHMSRKRHVLSS